MPSAWGFEVGGEQRPSLDAFLVQLDQRFLTQLAHTGAHFADLFPGASRKQLLKVSSRELLERSRVLSPLERRSFVR